VLERNGPCGSASGVDRPITCAASTATP
jgi:hypothetical protein